MLISVEVKVGSRKARIEERDGRIRAWVDAQAKDGKANERLVELLADHYGVARSRITIRRGRKSRRKLIEIVG